MEQTLQAVKITKHVYWVGAIDWDLRDFHGYSTARGTTYNAYLILGTEPILIDTVKRTHFAEMLTRIRSVIDPAKIKYIVSNHAEMDHSGCLLEMMELVQPEKVFASKNGAQALQAHFDIQQMLTVVNDKDQIVLGDATLSFIETRMLHWPDSMFTYFAADGILFSQDAFGMHLATMQFFADENDRAILRYEAAKYYANILLPYSQFVLKKLHELSAANLDLKVIAPDHGPVWRGQSDIAYIMDLWRQWAEQRSYPRVIITYDTMWQSTAKMAAAIADGVVAKDGMQAVVMPLNAVHRSDVVAELLESGALLVGSPTMNQQMFPTVASLLCYLKGLKRKNLIGQVFGSYGWAADAVKLLQAELLAMQVDLVDEPILVNYVPKACDLAKCRLLGEKVAMVLRTKATGSNCGHIINP